MVGQELVKEEVYGFRRLRVTIPGVSTAYAIAPRGCLLSTTYKSQRYRVCPGFGGNPGQEQPRSGDGAHCNDEDEFHNVQWELETVVEEAHFRCFCFFCIFWTGEAAAVKGASVSFQVGIQDPGQRDKADGRRISMTR